MAKDKAELLRWRFVKYIVRNWIKNNHDLKDIKCVYVIISLDYDNKKYDIEYVGSTTALRSRYKSHKVPLKIQNEGNINLLYYVPMEFGFYDYEIKLIKMLQPKFNKQHKNGRR